jgi:hypothetical protein
MSRTTRVSLLAVVLVLAGAACAACGDDDGAAADAGSIVIPDARVDASLAMECQRIQQDFVPLIPTISRACGTVADCTLIGAHTFPDSCGCLPTIGPCQGLAVNGAAFVGTDAYQVNFTFQQFCYDVDCGELGNCVCDCAPAELACIDNLCTTQPPAQLCNPPPMDAGI